MKDAPFAAGLGAGLELAMVKDVLSLVIEVNYLRGGYVRHLSVLPPVNTTLQNFRTSDGGISPVREHFTATIARSRLQVVDMRLGLFVII